MKKSNFHEDYTDGELVVLPSNKRFGLTVGSVFLVVACLRVALGHSGWFEMIFFVLGASLITAAFRTPARLASLNKGWMRLGLGLARIVNPVVLFLLFALCILPLGFLMRLCGNDPLRRAFDPSAGSYWIDKLAADRTSPMTNQF